MKKGGVVTEPWGGRPGDNGGSAPSHAPWVVGKAIGVPFTRTFRFEFI